MRVYSKKSDNASTAAVAAAADAYVRRRFGERVVSRTPQRPSTDSLRFRAEPLEEPSRKRKLML